MPIIVRLDVMLAKRKMTSKELAARTGITEANLSILRRGKAKGVRFRTLDIICTELRCTICDILEHVDEDSPIYTELEDRIG